MTKRMTVWVVTNLGGKNLFFQDYSGRLPVCYTKKEAQRELHRLNKELGKIHEYQSDRFERKIIKAVLTYEV